MRRLQAHMLLYRWGWIYTPEATRIPVGIHRLAYGLDNTLEKYL